MLSCHPWLDCYEQWKVGTDSITQYDRQFHARSYVGKLVSIVRYGRGYGWLVLYFDQRFAFLAAIVVQFTCLGTRIALAETYPSILVDRKRFTFRDLLVARLYAVLFFLADAVIVHSEYQADLYARTLKTDRRTFLVVPYYCYNYERPYPDLEQQRTSRPVVCPGRNRDLTTFFLAAAHVPRECIVICNREALEAIPPHIPKPENIVVFCDVDKEKYYEIMQNAGLVVLPFSDDGLVRSYGHMAFL